MIFREIVTPNDGVVFPEGNGKHAYKVGVHCPEFCDQPYIRDRDLWILADSESEAMTLWFVKFKTWIRADERHLVKVLETIENPKEAM